MRGVVGHYVEENVVHLPLPVRREQAVNRREVAHRDIDLSVPARAVEDRVGDVVIPGAGASVSSAATVAIAAKSVA